MLKRIFDIFFSVGGLVLLVPVLGGIAFLVVIDSKGPVFYRQVRVGKDYVDFKLFKFRTMHINADKFGLLTVGSRDPRITKIGYWLRKYKLDELPQLINVLTGDMSFVGPRPEVPKYVMMYDRDQQKVLSVKPGITDWASIQFRNENELLATSENAEKSYIEQIMPVKLHLNLEYIRNNNLLTDVKIILMTLWKVLLR